VASAHDGLHQSPCTSFVMMMQGGKCYEPTERDPGFKKEKYCPRRIQLVKERKNKPDNSFNWKPLK